jgi:hypothetical protein
VEIEDVVRPRFNSPFDVMFRRVPTKKSISLKPLHLARDINRLLGDAPVGVSLLICFRDSLRARVALQAEVVALRHHLLVLQPRKQKQRLRLSVADRLFWVWLSRVWADWKSALLIVRPETDGDCLASQRLSALLGLEESPSLRSPADLAGSATTDSTNEHSSPHRR